MRANKLFAILLLIVVFAGVALAKTVKVIVSFGNRGSQGQYACFLYRNNSSWDWKYLTNTGFASGTAQFDGLPAGTYKARIVCVNDHAERWTNSVTLAWWQTYGEIRAYF